MTTSDLRPGLTIVIPVYEERENIAAVIQEVMEVVADQDVDVVVVDDGSDDGTADIVRHIARRTPHLRLVRHPKRSGKSAALRSGVMASKTLWIGTMDGDGQDDPRDLLNLAAQVDLSTVGNVGLVGGVRQQRTDGASRKFASRFANSLRRSLLRDDCPDTACGLKVVPRNLFLAFAFFDALHRYLPALTKHMGFETRYVPVTNRERIHGKSKYSNIGRAAAGLVDLMGVSWLMRRTSVPSRDLILGKEHKEWADAA